MAIQGQAATTWFNPTSTTMVVEIFEQAPQSRRADGETNADVGKQSSTPSHRVRVEFPPGEHIVLPSAYDRAIHTVDQFGVVMGGLAPMLKRVGASDKLHPCLDPETEKRAKEEEQKAIVQKQMAAAAELMSAAKEAITAPSHASQQGRK